VLADGELGSSDGDDGDGEDGAAVPLIAAANAVTCLRTSISLLRVVSSRVTAADLDDVLPAVPVGDAGSPALLEDVEPSRSFRILSIAATSVPQFALPRGAVARGLRLAVPVALALSFAPAARSSAFKCRFRSPI
jgi:hypothetical protein